MVVYNRVADPGEVDPDPDPTFKKNRIWILPTKKDPDSDSDLNL